MIVCVGATVNTSDKSVIAWITNMTTSYQHPNGRVQEAENMLDGRGGESRCFSGSFSSIFNFDQ